MSTIWESSELSVWFFKPLRAKQANRLEETRLRSAWIYVLQKVSLGSLSDCERTYYGLMERQKALHSHFCQQTNTHQRASSPRSDKEMQSSSASIGPMHNSEEQITLCDWSRRDGISHILNNDEFSDKFGDFKICFFYFSKKKFEIKLNDLYQRRIYILDIHDLNICEENSWHWHFLLLFPFLPCKVLLSTF